MTPAKGGLRRTLVENELLERAAELFAERGFSGTTLQAVADAVGLTRAALYHYFPSKEALLTALVEGITANRASELARIRDDPTLDATAKLERATRVMCAEVATHPARFRLLNSNEHEMPPDLAARQARARRDVLEAMRAIIAEGVASGAFAPVDPRLAAFAVLGMCNWIAYWYKSAGARNADEIGDQYARFALAALRSPRDDGADVARIVASLRAGVTELDRLLG